MRRFFLKYFIMIHLTGLTCLFVYFSYLIQHKDLRIDQTPFERVMETGVIRLITNESLNTLYYYQGRPMGFEYDLAKAFADYLGVALDVVTPGWNNLFTYLELGMGDFIAAGLAITEERVEKVNFSLPYMTIQQHVIHHNLVFGPKNIEDFTFRTFHIRRGTSYHARLKEIKAAGGIDFTYVLHDNIPTDELIRMVHDREIKFTISDSNIAYLNQRHLPDITIGIPIQKKESLAWAVHKQDIQLLEQMNKFFLHANTTGLLKQISDKYYAGIDKTDPYDLKKFHQRIKTRLPKFKELIMHESLKYGFDWKLVAAVIYQESHFNPKARSFTNVKGLMQVTAATAKEMGIKNLKDPSQSIKAGIKYLDKMVKKFDYIPDEHERMLMGLASYNIGYGHVSDALKIAREKGIGITLEEVKWQDLRTVLPLLSKSAYYKKTKHGYARGWEPVKYVDRILTYYDILKQKDID